jgi:hypothetical protein
MEKDRVVQGSGVCLQNVKNVKIWNRFIDISLVLEGFLNVCIVFLRLWRVKK